MSSYRVCFYKHLVSSDGHPFKCLQGQIDVAGCESEAQAAAMASKVFETTYGLRDWKLHADSVEVVCLGAWTRAGREGWAHRASESDGPLDDRHNL